MKTTELIQELTEITNNNICEVEKFKTLNKGQLNAKPNETSWSILECLEHLNLYGDFYIPEINKRMNNSNIPSVENFKTGVLGNYFAKMLAPKEKLNKMKTFDSMNPLDSNLDESIINRFLNQQQDLLEIIEIAKTKNLNKIKTSISISNLIKLKLGDTLRVVIYHNKRHMFQAKKLVC
jgi:hypothetical protein